jgi:ABC-type transport system involved in cytochrome bd biosynthesis fused ATPase/permease subunit
LLDEATSGLDQETGGCVEALIASSLAGSTMVLMVTDDFAQAKGFARWVLRLDADKSEIGAL